MTSNIIAGIALLVTCLVAVFSYRQARRATAATESAAESARLSATSSVAAAHAAAETATLERERRHDEIAPRGLQTTFVQVPNPAMKNFNVFAVIVYSGDRTYRVRVNRVYKGGGTQGAANFDLVPGRSMDVYLGTSTAELATRLELAFEGDCQCGRSAVDGAHWLRDIEVPPPDEWETMEQERWQRLIAR